MGERGGEWSSNGQHYFKDAINVQSTTILCIEYVELNVVCELLWT